MQLLQQVQQYYNLSSMAQDALINALEEIVMEKNTLLIKEGTVCRYIYFLQAGAVRGYYNVEEKEITHWFGFENDFVTSFHSFITKQPSVENVQLLESSILWRISADALQTLFNEFHEIERVVRIAYEKYYIRLEERYVNAQFKTAVERYRSLLDQSPHIVERVSLGHIASYLGISQETLSRVRAKL